MRTKLTLGIVAALLAVLVGCASTPASLRLTSDDCLVLIPTRLENPDQAPTARQFSFRLSSGAALASVGQSTVGYVSVLVQGPDVKITGLTSDVRGQNVRGDSWAIDLSAQLPYEPAQVIIWDKTFVHKISKVGDHAFSSDYGFEATTSAVQAAVRADFDKSAAAADWKD